jgi:catechol 2,3-dioxygenase-like lactoylglutathione lyase family enzyme
MAVHHLALVTNDVEANHLFYTEAMGFRLAKVVAGETDHGWSRHIFYDTGDGGFIAFWDLHDESIPEVRCDISTALGLPVWVNHVAFGARDVAELRTIRQRWKDHGLQVMEVDHDWCRSVYTTDPNGILVEFCAMVRELGDDDADEALRLLEDPNPPLEPPIRPVERESV